jgi:hypothetical protein
VRSSINVSIENQRTSWRPSSSARVPRMLRSIGFFLFLQRMSRHALQRTHFVRSCGPSLIWTASPRHRIKSSTHACCMESQNTALFWYNQRKKLQQTRLHWRQTTGIWTKRESTFAIVTLFHYSGCKIIRYYSNNSDGLTAKNWVDYTVNNLVGTYCITGLSINTEQHSTAVRVFQTDSFCTTFLYKNASFLCLFLCRKINRDIHLH